ncbi:MAG: hypothetical protein EPO24_10785 [Bacteroidetes bacterium]|nr:MAG: hypothetical protein EPO24_10785 [Bacteroidota bacterium]
MSQLLYELCAHQAWADAEHWRVLEANPAALNDEQITKRLHHYHLTERAFLSIVRGEELVFRKLDDFATTLYLKLYAKQTSEGVHEFLSSVTESRLSEMLTIPWFKTPPLQITIEQALTQAAMHSHYHRAQNASRMREIGIEAPLTDYIAWIWKGKPEAAWG